MRTTNVGLTWIIHGNEDLQEGDIGFIANKANRSDVTLFVSLVCVVVCYAQVGKPKLGGMARDL